MIGLAAVPMMVLILVLALTVVGRHWTVPTVEVGADDPVESPQDRLSFPYGPYGR